MNEQAIGFIKEQIYAWVGNLLRDLDARGIDVSTNDVSVALEQVAYMIDAEPTKEELDEFLKDITDGREWE